MANSTVGLKTLVAFSLLSRITLQPHVVQESEPKSNGHAQIVARAGSANLMDAKAASSSLLPSRTDRVISCGWFGLASSNG
jgi:hypothetical protein